MTLMTPNGVVPIEEDGEDPNDKEPMLPPPRFAQLAFPRLAVTTALHI